MQCCCKHCITIDFMLLIRRTFYVFLFASCLLRLVNIDTDSLCCCQHCSPRWRRRRRQRRKNRRSLRNQGNLSHQRVKVGSLEMTYWVFRFVGYNVWVSSLFCCIMCSLKQCFLSTGIRQPVWREHCFIFTWSRLVDHNRMRFIVWFQEGHISPLILHLLSYGHTFCSWKCCPLLFVLEQLETVL